jgi:hypothetical protein
MPSIITEGRILLRLSECLKGANITSLRVVWRENDGIEHSGIIPVHIESGEELLPPEEFRVLTASGILECLLSGRDPAEWVESLERRKALGQHNAEVYELDSLRAVDTDGYVLYRVRRLGAALSVLGERLIRTVRTQEAMGYRLVQDPLSPRMLAEALVREWKEESNGNSRRTPDPAMMIFSIIEINLLLINVARRINESKIRTLFRDAIEAINEIYSEAISEYTPPGNLREYLSAVKGQFENLFGNQKAGGQHAD